MKTTLVNRRIILGISGGIAAYKSAEFVRRLKDLGAQVRVIMTDAAQEFITPLTLQALSGLPVHTSLLDSQAEAAMGHIELARWGDMLVIAPASADVIARIAHGQGNDLLTTVCLARRCPLAVAPAMNEAMWHHSSTSANLKLLQQQGVLQLGPDSGEQACGDVGYGRMSDPAALAQMVLQSFTSRSLEGVKLCITAGPTQEAIDPVRFISNHSSGKMGYALAQAAADAGAQVTLISGPVNLACPESVSKLDVVSALDMHQACMDQMGETDIFIATAAVADFRPLNIETQKIKKIAGEESMSVELTKNPDIVADVAAHSLRPKLVVGFAAETQHVLQYAQNKLHKKGLDLIVANDVSSPGIGFNSDENEVTLIGSDQQVSFGLGSKSQLAVNLIESIAQKYQQKITDYEENRDR